jgi:hypothetical protein
VIRRLAFVGVSIALLTGCSADSVQVPAAPAEPTTQEKRIAVEDLRSALITDADLPDDGWRLSDKPITIGQSDGRTWLPKACGDRFTEIFDTDLAPPTEDFVTITYERPDANDFRVVTENISGWRKAPDIAAVNTDFQSLIRECATLTSDQVSLTLAPLDIRDAAAIRITYGAAVLNFNLDIAYAPVGPYLVGITNTGVATTNAELSDLLDRAVQKLRSTLETAPAMPDGVTPA